MALNNLPLAVRQIGGEASSAVPLLLTAPASRASSAQPTMNPLGAAATSGRRPGLTALESGPAQKLGPGKAMVTAAEDASTVMAERQYLDSSMMKSSQQDADGQDESSEHGSGDAPVQQDARLQADDRATDMGVGTDTGEVPGASVAAGVSTPPALVGTGNPSIEAATSQPLLSPDAAALNVFSNPLYSVAR